MGSLISKLIGNYHNTSVFNATNDRTVIVLTDNERKKTQLYLNPNDLKYIPTSKGQVTISASPILEDVSSTTEIFRTESITSDANFGFIITKQDEQLIVSRASVTDPRSLK